MSWKARCVMDERRGFIEDWLKGEWTVVSLCRAYGVSRKTGYKWIARFKESGFVGLEDRSRAPMRRPNAVPPGMVERIVATKRAHVRFGPLKILHVLKRQEPDLDWPAASTIGDILDRHGLVSRAKRRRKSTPGALPLQTGGAPNEVWCADFKGWFKTGDGSRCMPLTISDHYSRYLIGCHGLGGRTGFEEVQPLFELAFRECGLPLILHTDNGAPFASTGLAGLSRLSVWWLKLGIWPQRSRAGHPQDNGRHERMHKTLKQYTADPPEASLPRQQAAFAAFLDEFNQQRPHEALGQTPPAEHYHRSRREFPQRLLSRPDYPDEWEVRKVKNSGRIKWKGKALGVNTALTGEYLGLKPLDDGLWELYFLHYPLGVFDETRYRIRPRKNTPHPKTKERE